MRASRRGAAATDQEVAVAEAALVAEATEATAEPDVAQAAQAAVPTDPGKAAPGREAGLCPTRVTSPPFEQAFRP